WPHRRRGGHDGTRAAYRAQRGARPCLRRVPQGDRKRPAALRRAARGAGGRRPAWTYRAEGIDRPGELSRRDPSDDRPCPGRRLSPPRTLPGHPDGKAGLHQSDDEAAEKWSRPSPGRRLWKRRSSLEHRKANNSHIRSGVRGGMMAPDNFAVARTVAVLRDVVAEWRQRQEAVALVPTMGALHRGHLALVEAARRHCGRVVAALFVNPEQFGPPGDFSAYPPDAAADPA